MSPALTIPPAQSVAPSRAGFAGVGLLGFIAVAGIAAFIVYDKSGRLDDGEGVRVDANFYLNSIKASLLSYRNTTGGLPTTEQGLMALVERPVDLPAARNWRKIWNRVPVDSWGSPFLYENPGKRNPESFDIFSAGPDGKPNTSDDVWPK